MELLQTGEKYNGLPMYLGLFHGNCKYYKAEKK